MTSNGANNKHGNNGLSSQLGGTGKSHHRREFPLSPGWCFAFITAAGCFALIDHVSKRAFLDLKEAPRSGALWRHLGHASGSDTNPHQDEQTTSSLTPQQAANVELALPALLRKSKQYMTTAEAVRLVDNFTRTSTTLISDGSSNTAPDATAAAVVDTTLAAVAPVSGERFSDPLPAAGDLYTAVQQRLGRCGCVPLTYYDDPLVPNNETAKRRAEKRSINVPLPPGSYEDDQWVVNHVLGVATHQAVSSSCRFLLPHSSTTTSKAHQQPTLSTSAAMWNPRRRFFATVVCANPFQWTWQSSIKALLDATCDPALAVSLCVDDDTIPRMASATARALTTAEQLSRLGELSKINREGRSVTTSLTDVLRRLYQHHRLLLDADGSFELSLLLGDSRKDALYYQRWRHLGNRTVELRVAGMWVEQSMAALIVQSMVVAPSGSHAAVHGTSEEELPPYALIPIAFNGTVDSLEDMCNDSALAAMGQLLSEWLVTSSTCDNEAVTGASTSFWKSDVMPLCSEVGICDASIVRWKAPLVLTGQIRLSS
jgi:hypothetical protein